eukprot:CAMPEP_0176411352 /NCGR_PEP_ID=MMETSP0127-20121128/3561_1 /TAXON_ID=938130 /ORGANISM="Platyophrya macrostoma, Strain WH" /LENGTH=1184 /DNA_ID=CAMNT_0017790943 /DNA_START=110 /DNA_END=3664 /DNA_ORIENTATION=+
MHASSPPAQQPPILPVAAAEAEDAVPSSNDAQFLDRYSRQIGTFGLDTMTKLVSLKVLIVGCGGVGAEAAKNLALAGVHSITLLDPRIPSLSDLNVNFALDEVAVGEGRSPSIAESTRRLLHELNPMVRCHVVSELTEEMVSQHSVLVWTSAAKDISLRTLNRWNSFCRSRTPVVSFLFVLQTGAVASLFVDHGPTFTVKDLDGRPLLQKQIVEVTDKKDKSGHDYTRVRFATPEGQTPGALRDYTAVRFTDVKGLLLANGESINDKTFNGVICPCDPRNTLRIYPSLTSQGYTTPYTTGGFIHEQKEVVEVKFRPLKDALVAPGVFTTVSPFMDGALESLVHVTMVGLLEYAEHHSGSLPPLHDASAADEVLHYAKGYLNENIQMEPATSTTDGTAEVEESPENSEFPGKYPPPPAVKPLQLTSDLDEAFVRRTSMIARAEMQPLGAFFGAVVAQEIVKITGKYTPVHQFFNFHCAEVLPSNDYYASNPEDFAPRNSRYDHNIAIFGAKVQERLVNLKLFMVGCGALGCENIKNFALNGMCCGASGHLVVTDNDRIEISNLSRQFLFREDNVGQPKSVAACNRMLSMNKGAKVDARQDFVGPTTQYLYPDAFWMQLDAVVNALDNIEARLYVDKQCVLFHKILVEAGTMGTGGNVDIIVPGKTTSYADGGAADETGGIPMCTLRNFPYIYDHCIEWARAQFDDLYVSPVQQSALLIEDPTGFAAKLRGEISKAETAGQRRSLLEKHIKSLTAVQGTLEVVSSKPTMHHCVQMAWKTLHALFRDRILDLQHAFPKDATKSNGEPFWSGHRTFPTALDGTPTQLEEHPDIVEFLISASNLFATMFGIHPPKPAPRFNDPKSRWMHQYRTKEWILSELRATEVPSYHHHAVDGLDEESAGAAKSEGQLSDEDLQNQFETCLSNVESTAVACKGSKADPVDFEKDDDDNFHIDFITAAANLRAINYSIKPQDRLKVKMVAGKIIPAIATTTAAVTGLALIEFFKVLQDKEVSDLRNGMIDVGTNNYVLFERDAPIRKRTAIEKTYVPEKDYTFRKKVIRVPDGFTKYDRFTIDVTPTTTVQEFGDALLEQVNATLPEGTENTFDILALGVGQGTIWNGSVKHSNTKRPLLTVIEEQKRREGFPEDKDFWATRELYPELVVNLTIDDEDDVDDIDVETATVVLRIVKA